jgi:basic membrane lipoprotein Med (substrate-binding protein (PBP1-ABC) superfamily)
MTIIDSKYWMTLFLFATLISACGQASQSPLGANKNKSSQKSLYDTSKISIINFNKSIYWLFDSASKASILTDADIWEVERLFNESIADYNSKIKKKEDKKYFAVDLQKFNYKRQYVCVTNKDGQKVVYVNCFCETIGVDWKSTLIQVEDGGNCFFNLKINLNTKKYYDFFVNGYA